MLTGGEDLLFGSRSGIAANILLIIGEVPEWPKGADCKSAGDAFEGSNPSLSTIFRGDSSVGRARAFQARGRGFESRFPLQFAYGGVPNSRWLKLLSSAIRDESSTDVPR